ncbi:choice-of-anchor Q domain-containing protein [Dokdonella sp.]|uniref:choice-of-anchor Q domain-containing protein n=1 Tax=Dokdonella sp. TaxID=2291710 RepID=UPI003C386C93
MDAPSFARAAARLALAALLAFPVFPALATTFHIDPVNGSDNGDGSASAPWRSLQAVLDANLVESRDWPSFPYQSGMSLVQVNAGAPVRAGDTLLLASGYYGDIEISHLYNAAPITIAAQSGQTPRLRSLLVQSAQNWVLRGLSISPSHAATNTPTTMVKIDSHNHFGPTWDIELSDSDLFSVPDASSWSAQDWLSLASSGVNVGGDRISVVGNRLRNLRFGISVGGADARIRQNLIDGFSADGLRGLGDRGVFEYNRVQNIKVGDPPDSNHDDGFQSWSVGAGGVGTGEVTGVVLRGNVFISTTDPNDPLRTSMQGIGCFDGFFVDWVVENNVVITDHWHGISFYGMRDSRIVNNTVIDINASSPGPPWIMVHAHKDGRPSSNVVVRNNLATDFSLAANNLISDHNLEFVNANAGALFVAPPLDMHLLPGTAAVDTGSATLAPLIDAEGVPRPQGTAIDLGAYEWRGDAIFADGFDFN